jgi:hypothetical protein
MASARSAVPLYSRKKSSRILKVIPIRFQLEAGRAQNTIARGSYPDFSDGPAAYTFRSRKHVLLPSIGGYSDRASQPHCGHPWQIDLMFRGTGLTVESPRREGFDFIGERTTKAILSILTWISTDGVLAPLASRVTSSLARGFGI